MDFVPFVILALMVTKLIDWVLDLIPDEVEGKILLPVSWLVGIGVVVLFSLSNELAEAITVWGDHTLASASLPLLLVYGFAVGTGSNVIHDVAKRPESDISFETTITPVDLED